MTLNDRKLGSLWGAIIGDALGVPVEFSSRKERGEDPVVGMRGYGQYNQPPGTWSDDSSMLLCTVEALSEPEYSAKQLAGMFLNWRQYGYMTPHGDCFDIGIATSKALSRFENGTPPEESGGTEEGDNGNGSLMRILPVALRYTDAPIEDMLFIAHRISAITHRHPRSQMACGLYCIMAKALLNGMTPPQSYRYMVKQGSQFYNTAPFAAEYPHFTRILTNDISKLPEADIASKGYVINTLEASLWCLLTSNSFEETVLKAVNLGGDTDTTGCVAGGLAGLYYGMASIQQAWIDAIVRKDDIGEILEKFIGV
ncbi:MAG: ADP-ribosylglycohydrolase family protein [bacterium]